MRIVHHIGINPDKKQKKFLIEIGIQVPELNNPVTNFFAFDVYEDSREYERLRKYIIEWQLLDMIGTEFTDEEINNATMLVTHAQWLNGFPQPEQDFEYLNKTYDFPPGACKNCRLGKVQKEFFRIHKKPNWGNKKIFHLNWVFDELFVRKDIYEAIFKKYGLAVNPVKLYKKEIIVEDTVQLIIPEVDIPLKLDEFPYETNNVCGHKKFVPYFRGFFPSFDGPIDLPIWKSTEWFGSGGSAFKRIFITQKVRQDLLTYKIKMDFVPVK